MSAPKQSLITPGFLGATILVVALFFFWGVSNSLNDVLIPQFRKTFLLGDFTSSWCSSPRSSATSRSRFPRRCSCGASVIAPRW